MRQKVVAHVSHKRRARVDGFVQPVAEPHQAKRIVPSFAQRDISGCLDVPILEHRETASFAPPCAGPHKLAMPAATHANGFALTTPRCAPCSCWRFARGRVEHQDRLQALGGDQVDFVRARGQREQHVHEVLREIQVIARVHDGLAVRGLVRHGGERGHLPDHAQTRQVARLGVLVIQPVVLVVKRGERTHDGHHDGHRVRVVLEPVEEPDEVLVDHAVSPRLALKHSSLRPGGQRPAQQQVPAIHHVAVLRELLNGVAAVQQASVLAVDVRDRGRARRRGVEPGVERAHPVLGVEPAHVQKRRARGIAQHGELEHAAVGQREGRRRRGFGAVWRHRASGLA